MKKINLLFIGIILAVGIVIAGVGLSNTQGTIKGNETDKAVFYKEYGNINTSNIYWDETHNKWTVDYYSEKTGFLKSQRISGNKSESADNLQAEVDYFAQLLYDNLLNELKQKSVPNPEDKSGRNYILSKTEK